MLYQVLYNHFKEGIFLMARFIRSAITLMFFNSFFYFSVTPTDHNAESIQTVNDAAQHSLLHHCLKTIEEESDTFATEINKVMGNELKGIGFVETICRSCKPVVIKFSADWCGPCKRMAPFFKKASSTCSDKAHFYEINVDTTPKILKTLFNISVVPTVVYLKQGTEIGRTNSDSYENIVTRVESLTPHNIICLEALCRDNVDEDRNAEKTTQEQALLSYLTQTSKPVVLYIYSDWAPTCRTMQQTLEQIARTYNDQVIIVTAEAEKLSEDFLENYDICYLPTCIYFKNETEQDRSVDVTEQSLVENIKLLLE